MWQLHQFHGLEKKPQTCPEKSHKCPQKSKNVHLVNVMGRNYCTRWAMWENKHEAGRKMWRVVGSIPSQKLWNYCTRWATWEKYILTSCPLERWSLHKDPKMSPKPHNVSRKFQKCSFGQGDGQKLLYQVGHLRKMHTGTLTPCPLERWSLHKDPKCPQTPQSPINVHKSPKMFIWPWWWAETTRWDTWEKYTHSLSPRLQKL